MGGARRAAGPTRGGRQQVLSSLDALTEAEQAVVLRELLRAHPALRQEAEKRARALLRGTTVEEVADGVSGALLSLPLEDLGARAGRVRGRGYVHETDAAWELVQEAVEPFLGDMRRRASVGQLDGAAVVTVGIVAGLHDVGEPEGATVLGYAGPDTPGELAGEVLTEAERLGLEVPDDAHDRYWPEWTDLT